MIVNLETAMHRLRLIRQSEGATAIEYALIASLIAIAAIAGMNNIGSRTNLMFNNVSNHL